MIGASGVSSLAPRNGSGGGFETPPHPERVLKVNLSSGARRLLNHLQFLDRLERGCIIFQRSLAGRFRVCTRTIRRWLTELRLAGFIDEIRRRGRTSAKVVMSTRMSTQEAENVHSNEPPPIFTEITEEKEQSALRKGPQMEQRLTERRSNARFEEFIGIFVAAGKPLNAGDVGAARVLWPLLSFEDRARAIAAIEKQLRATESAAYMPLPVNFLRAKPWTRTALTRSLPYDKPSKILDRLSKAEKYLQDTYGDDEAVAS